jgi:flavodoxin
MSIRTLVAFYSFSHTTERLAEEIALLTDGDLCPLIPEKPYAFDYNTAAKQARQEIERGYCPKLTSGIQPVDGYSHIFVGTPNWFKSYAPPVLTFLRYVNLSGKTIIPFCTHGGGGLGHIETDMMRECPRSKFLPGYAAMSDFDTQQVSEWLAKIGFE